MFPLWLLPIEFLKLVASYMAFGLLISFFLLCLYLPFGLLKYSAWLVDPTPITGLRDRPVVPPSPSHSIRILTLNTFLRIPGVSHHHRGGDWKWERVNWICDNIFPHYDVIALQEVYGFLTLRRRELLKRARQAGFHYYILPRPPSLFSGKWLDSSLLLLSRYPVIEHDEMVFTDATNTDSWMAKGCMWARIQIDPEREWNIFTTHLQATYFKQDKKADAVQRRQLQQLREWMSEVTGQQCPALTILCGDFNIDDSSSNYQLMMELFSPWLKDCFSEETEGFRGAETGKEANDASSIVILYDRKSGGEVGTTSEFCKLCSREFGQEESRQRLDYMWVHHHLDPESDHCRKIQSFKPTPSGTPWSQVSDHKGLEARVSIQSGPMKVSVAMKSKHGRT